MKLKNIIRFPIKLYLKIAPRWRKYVITLLAFIIYILFFDENNLINQTQQVNKLKQLRKDKQYYIDQIKESEKRLKELTTDTKSLEKFAREQYLMKKDSEDIFVIVYETDSTKENNDK